jgi:hypothetical protein
MVAHQQLAHYILSTRPIVKSILHERQYRWMLPLNVEGGICNNTSLIIISTILHSFYVVAFAIVYYRLCIVPNWNLPPMNGICRRGFLIVNTFVNWCFFVTHTHTHTHTHTLASCTQIVNFDCTVGPDLWHVTFGSISDDKSNGIAYDLVAFSICMIVYRMIQLYYDKHYLCHLSQLLQSCNLCQRINII